MKLYDAMAPNPRRVRIFAAEKGMDLPRETLDLQSGQARTAEFLARNSLGQVPVLELDDGTIVTESVAICRYLEGLQPAPALFGSDPKDSARIEMWNRRMEIEILATIGNVAQHSLAFFKDKVTQIPAFAASQMALIPQKWTWLDGELADGRPFVAGDRFSVADITGMVATKLSELLGSPIPDDLPLVKRWDAQVRARPSWNA